MKRPGIRCSAFLLLATAAPAVATAVMRIEVGSITAPSNRPALTS